MVRQQARVRQTGMSLSSGRLSRSPLAFRAEAKKAYDSEVPALVGSYISFNDESDITLQGGLVKFHRGAEPTEKCGRKKSVLWYVQGPLGVCAMAAVWIIGWAMWY